VESTRSSASSVVVDRTGGQPFQCIMAGDQRPEAGGKPEQLEKDGVTK